MTSKIIENYVASNRQGAIDAFQLKSKPKEIFVYVEGFDDISFWHNILSPYEKQNNIKFKIKPYSLDRFMDGKKGLQKSFNQVGEYLIICLDSDYDYLFPKDSREAERINESNYIFQTYTYSIENLKCYSENLFNLCVQATQNTDEKIDFSAFFKNYSETIYPLFLWNLYFYSVKQEENFTNKKFLTVIKIIDTPRFENNGKDVLDKIEQKVKAKIEELEKRFPDDIEKIVLFSKILKKVGLLNSNAYLFIKGHTLYDNVVLILLKPLCTNLIRIHENQVEKLSKKEKKKLLEKHAEELSEKEIQKKANKHKRDREESYRKSQTKIEILLSVNDKFRDCFLFKKIEKDIEAYLEIIETSKTHV